jgi:hypothetical protein
MVYSKDPSSTPNYVPGSSSIEVGDSIIATSQELLQAFHKKLLQVNKICSKLLTKVLNGEYNVGDFVYLKLRPYR